MGESTSILVVAGEESGDRLGAMLLDELKKLAPTIASWGIGGSHLADAGLRVDIPLEEVNVVGFWEVVRNYRRLRSTYDRLLDSVRRDPPRFAILIDFPGFNLRLARDLASLGVPVLYYVAPQTWAWKEGRVAAMARTISRLVVLFPFEVDYFRRHGVPAVSFGHPLVKPLAAPKSEARSPEHIPTIAYFPGSRAQELRRHLPLVRGVIEGIGASARHVIARAESVAPDALRTGLSNLPIEIVDAGTALEQADLALVKVGTSTLNAALAGVPFVAFYRTSWATYLLARALVKLPTITMPNIIAGRKVIDEYIQGDATVEKLTGAVRELLDDRERRARLQNELAGIGEALAQPDTISRTALAIAEWFGLAPRQSSVA